MQELAFSVLLLAILIAGYVLDSGNCYGSSSGGAVPLGVDRVVA